MKNTVRYPTLTPLRALALLLELTERAGFEQGKGISASYASERARREIGDHVLAGYVPAADIARVVLERDQAAAELARVTAIAERLQAQQDAVGRLDLGEKP